MHFYVTGIEELTLLSIFTLSHWCTCPFLHADVTCWVRDLSSSGSCRLSRPSFNQPHPTFRLTPIPLSAVGLNDPPCPAAERGCWLSGERGKLRLPLSPLNHVLPL